MSGTNMTELSDKLGSWNWSVATNLSWSVVDHAPVNVGGIPEQIAMVHVRFFVGYLGLPFLTIRF